MTDWPSWAKTFADRFGAYITLHEPDAAALDTSRRGLTAHEAKDLWERLRRLTGSLPPAERRSLASMAEHFPFRNLLEGAQPVLQEHVVVIAVGGAAPGLNVLFKGLASDLLQKGHRVSVVLGGAQGLLSKNNNFHEITIDELADLSEADAAFTYGITRAPKEDGVVDTIMASLKAAQPTKVVVFGGDGGMHFAHLLQSRTDDFDVIGLPKSLDGNVSFRLNEGLAPRRVDSAGFESAIDYAVKLIRMAQQRAKENKEIVVVEINGRNTGWLTMMSAVKAGIRDYFIPEQQPSINQLDSALKKLQEEGGGVLLVSEAVDFRDAKEGAVVNLEDLHRSVIDFPSVWSLQVAMKKRNITLRHVTLTPLLNGDESSKYLSRESLIQLYGSAKSQRRINLLVLPPEQIEHLGTFQDEGPIVVVKNSEDIDLDAFQTQFEEYGFGLIILSDKVQWGQQQAEDEFTDVTGRTSLMGRRVGAHVAAYAKEHLGIPAQHFVATHLLIAAPTSEEERRSLEQLGQFASRALLRGARAIMVARDLLSGEIMDIPLDKVDDHEAWGVHGFSESSHAMVQRAQAAAHKEVVYTIGNGNASGIAQLMQLQNGDIFVGIRPLSLQDFYRLTRTPEWQLDGPHVSLIRPQSIDENLLKMMTSIVYIGDDGGSLSNIIENDLLTVDDIRALPERPGGVVLVYHIKEIDDSLRRSSQILEELIAESGREDIHVVGIGGFTSDDYVRAWTRDESSKIYPVIAGKNKEAVERVVHLVTGQQVNLNSEDAWQTMTTPRMKVEFAYGREPIKLLDIAGFWKNMGIVSTSYALAQSTAQYFNKNDFDTAQLSQMQVLFDTDRAEATMRMAAHYLKQNGFSDDTTLNEGLLLDSDLSGKVDLNRLLFFWDNYMRPFIADGVHEHYRLKEGFRKLLRYEKMNLGSRNNRAGLALGWAQYLKDKGAIADLQEAFFEDDWDHIWNLSGPKSLKIIFEKGRSSILSPDLQNLTAAWQKKQIMTADTQEVNLGEVYPFTPHELLRDWDGLITEISTRTGKDKNNLRQRWNEVAAWFSEGGFLYKEAIAKADDYFRKPYALTHENIRQWKTLYQMAVFLGLSDEEIESLLPGSKENYVIGYANESFDDGFWQQVGLDLKPGETYLELGAGDGTKAVDIAIVHPQSQVRVIDGHPKNTLSQIRKANEAGLSPFRFQVAVGDLRDPPPYPLSSVHHIAMFGAPMFTLDREDRRVLHHRLLALLAVPGGHYYHEAMGQEAEHRADVQEAAHTLHLTVEGPEDRERALVFHFRKRFERSEAAQNFSGIDQRRLQRILNQPELDSKALIDELKKSAFLAPLWGKTVVFRENQTLQEHTETVLGLFERYFSNQRRVTDLMPRGLFRLVLALHDIGKPLAIEAGDVNLQHEYTLIILDSFLEYLGYSEQDRFLACMLIDLKIGHYYKASRSVHRFIEALNLRDAHGEQAMLPDGQMTAGERIAFYTNGFERMMGVAPEVFLEGVVRQRSGHQVRYEMLARIAQEVLDQSELSQWPSLQLLALKNIYYQVDAGAYTTAARGSPQLPNGRSAFDDLFLFDPEHQLMRLNDHVLKDQLFLYNVLEHVDDIKRRLSRKGWHVNFDFLEKSFNTRAAKKVADTIENNPQARLLLPTGNTPKGMYEALLTEIEQRRLDVSGVTIFMLDEYVGGSDYKQYIEHNFIDRLPIGNRPTYYVLNGLTDHIDEEVSNYERLIREQPIDLAVLGIGQEGHIAFNEAGSTPDSVTRRVELHESTLQANKEARVKGYTHALTVGISTILSANEIVVLANSRSKGAILGKMQYVDPSSAIPASWLVRHPNVHFYLTHNVFDFGLDSDDADVSVISLQPGERMYWGRDSMTGSSNRDRSISRRQLEFAKDESGQYFVRSANASAYSQTAKISSHVAFYDVPIDRWTILEDGQKLWMGSSLFRVEMQDDEINLHYWGSAPYTEKWPKVDSVGPYLLGGYTSMGRHFTEDALGLLESNRLKAQEVMDEMQDRGLVDFDEEIAGLEQVRQYLHSQVEEDNLPVDTSSEEMRAPLEITTRSRRVPVSDGASPSKGDEGNNEPQGNLAVNLNPVFIDSDEDKGPKAVRSTIDLSVTLSPEMRYCLQEVVAELRARDLQKAAFGLESFINRPLRDVYRNLMGDNADSEDISLLMKRAVELWGNPEDLAVVDELRSAQVKAQYYQWSRINPVMRPSIFMGR